MLTLDNVAQLSGVPIPDIVACADTLSKVMRGMRLPAGAAAKLLLDETAKVRGAEDARFYKWSARVRIFGYDSVLEADSDPDLIEGQPGSETCQGLPGVAAYASALVCGYHGSSVHPQAVRDAFDTRVASLRVAIHRGNTGSGLWSVPYDCNGKQNLCRVDVRRAIDAPSNVKRHRLGDPLPYTHNA